MIPYDNKQEALNWLNERTIRPKENKENGKQKSLTNKVRRTSSLEKKNSLLKLIMVVLFTVSFTFLMLKLTAWDQIVSVATRTLSTTIDLPVNDLNHLKTKLLGRGFPRDITNIFLSSSAINGVDQKAKAVIRLKNNNSISFNYVDQRDKTEVAFLLAIAFIVFIPISFLITFMRKRKDNFKKHRCTLTYDFVRVGSKWGPKDILFVKSINNAEAIVESKGIL